LTKEYIDIGFPQIASFCLLHVGDFRLLRDEAITYGLGGLFDKVIQEITKYVSPSGISMNRDLSLRSTSVAKLSKVASRFCDSFQPRIPEGATHASYLIHQLGLLDQENGKIDEAVTKFERAINENPYYWAYYEDLLRLLCLEGRKNEVEQVVISLHKLDAYAKCWLYFVAKEFIRYLKVIDGMRYLLRSLTSYPVSTLRFIFKDIKYILERFLP
jgi:tetratricopeptide (TPR) repeat protein